jgi:hypothetical protein
MKKLLLSAAILIFAAPAWAQDNAIRVVNPDGSTSVFEIPGSMPQVSEDAPAPEPQLRKLQPEAPAAAEIKPAPLQKEVVKKEEPPEPAPVKKAVAPEPSPAPAPVPMKKEKPAPVAETAKEETGTFTRIPPPPARKPSKNAAPADEIASPSRRLREQDLLSRNEAVGIALRDAPPASDFKVFQRMFEGGPVYAVVFKTENGVHEVMVDAFTGEIVGKPAPKKTKSKKK